MNVFFLLALLGTTVAEKSSFQLLSAVNLENFELRHGQELLNVAAKPSETVNISLESSYAGAFVQERVDVNINCFPWLVNFPGGRITWILSRFSVTAETGEIEGVEPPIEVVVLGQPRYDINGDFDQFLNITSTVSIETRDEIADHGNYTCRVCIAQGTPLEECHDSTLMLYLPGAPPNINVTDGSNFPDSIGSNGELVFRSGADFCIERGTDVAFRIECDILQPNSADRIALAFPPPFRTWEKDGFVIYNTTDGNDPQVNMDFYLLSIENRLLFPGFVQPVVFLPTIDGAITFQTRVDSVLFPIDNDVAQDMLFDAFIGEWTCSAGNAYGLETVTTNIRECGDPPMTPQCQGESDSIFFPDSNIPVVVSVACDMVCIRPGTSIFLSCRVTAGDPPLSYTWVDGSGRLIANGPLFFITRPDNYTCTVTSRDFPDNIQTSSVSFTLRQFFTGVIHDEFTNKPRSDNGCTRLSEEVTADVCVFVGETLNLTCVSENGTQTNIIDPIGMSQGGNVSIISTTNNFEELNGTFECFLIGIEGPCGLIPRLLSVQVYDPARINRVDNLGSPGALGVGRFNEIQVVPANSTVTLFCPTTGIPTPMESWRKVTLNQFGMAMEVVFTGEEDGLNLLSREGVLELTIDNFSLEDEGTYVCRTTNAAGEDADTISLTTRPLMSAWSTGDWTECDNPCAEAIRRRSVVCREMRAGDNCGRIIADSRCDLSTEPPSSQTCEAIFFNTCFLDPIWIPLEWSACSHGCEGGYRIRDVQCQVPTTGVIRPVSDCVGQIRPHSLEFCRFRCCLEDTYPTYCSYIGIHHCDDPSIRRECCWSCGLTEVP